ncbi:hypothetical protein BRM3_08190 [Brachybacterium huguangmaarense]|uniref:Uncharacterized protein n=1 Tax=Brachybacterium huguangmaarense TaxID=1652028 RepID=A0ABY6FYY5_9MICO|nr:hypothetical protein [Brachybacterium huguangmaarense]UYG15628.1 hypothetical protein BRM3_08190 [Brachybacterium huguangmaarense]
MATYTQLRRLAADCRIDHEKAPVAPDDLDALLDIAEQREQPAASTPARTSPTVTAGSARRR